MIDSFGNMGLSFPFTLDEDKDQHDDFYITLNNHFVTQQLVVPYAGIATNQFQLRPFGETFIDHTTSDPLPPFSSMPLTFLSAGTQARDGLYRFQKKEPYQGVFTYSVLKKLPKLNHPDNPSIMLILMSAFGIGLVALVLKPC